MKAVIFDFDGTIADSFQTAIDIFYELTHRDPLPAQDISRLRGLKPRQLAGELHIPMWRVPMLLARGRRIMRHRMTDVALISGMDTAIRELQKEYKLFVLSSNSRENVQAFLHQHGLDGVFVELHGGVGLFGKARRLRRIVRDHGLDVRQTWYVGDEARDVEAAHHARLKVVAVTWGFNNLQVLKSHQPTALAFDPDELVRSIKNNG